MMAARVFQLIQARKEPNIGIKAEDADSIQVLLHTLKDKTPLSITIYGDRPLPYQKIITAMFMPARVKLF